MDPCSEDNLTKLKWRLDSLTIEQQWYVIAKLEIQDREEFEKDNEGKTFLYLDQLCNYSLKELGSLVDFFLDGGTLDELLEKETPALKNEIGNAKKNPSVPVMLTCDVCNNGVEFAIDEFENHVQSHSKEQIIPAYVGMKIKLSESIGKKVGYGKSGKTPGKRLCGVCVPCRSEKCNICKYCLDPKRFKRGCIMTRCENPNSKK